MKYPFTFIYSRSTDKIKFSSTFDIFPDYFKLPWLFHVFQEHRCTLTAYVCSPIKKVYYTNKCQMVISGQQKNIKEISTLNDHLQQAGTFIWVSDFPTSVSLFVLSRTLLTVYHKTMPRWFICHITKIDSPFLSDNLVQVCITRAVSATKPEATAIGNSARWPLENNLNVWWAQVLCTEI